VRSDLAGNAVAVESKGYGSRAGVIVKSEITILAVDVIMCRVVFVFRIGSFSRDV
jgi:hypothetical protein